MDKKEAAEKHEDLLTMNSVKDYINSVYNDIIIVKLYNCYTYVAIGHKDRS